MSWKKHFRAAYTGGTSSPISGPSSSASANFGVKNYQSHLPDVYVGHPNRIERYNQYEQMDADSEVNAALDIIAEFSTQSNVENGTAFDIQFNEKPTDNEIKIIKEQLRQWNKLNQFDKRIFKLFRNTIKYGDQVFVRDPETFQLLWSEMSKVTKVIVNESDGKKPEQYVLKELNPNLQNLTVTAVTTSDTYMNHPQIGGPVGTYTPTVAGQGGGSRFATSKNESVIDAEHIVHISLTEGLDIAWPFGNSILETIFKVFKQKELLEDAIIIYRIQRAPERRVFKIDVGNMPSHMAMAFVERVKNEVHQRRIPTQSGSGTPMMDATYNPICLDLETKIPLLDGRTLTLSDMINEFESGKENWVYSCNPETGEVVPGVVNWAGITRKNTETIKLTFDNGKELICTPDHKIPVLGKGFVEAKDLTVEDSLIAFNTQEKSISGGKSSKYQKVWDHLSKKWIWTHRMVGEFFRARVKHQEFTYLFENYNKVKSVIHHKDSNRFNNDPRNLTYMNKEDHILYHSAQKKDFWENMTDEYRQEMTDKISKTLKDRWLHLSETDRLNELYKIRQAQKKSVWLRKNNLEVAKRYSENMSKAQKKATKTIAGRYDQLCKNLENRIHWKNQKINLTQDMLSIVVKYVKDGNKKKFDVISLCDKDTTLLSMIKEANIQDIQSTQCKIDFDKFGYSKLERLLDQFGYDGWKDFVKKVDLYNHKIMSIEKVSNRDTGTITVDGNERWHDYHTFAIDSGIFVKNSMNEDFFFPQTEGGRGSSVEILAGGCLAMDTKVPLLDGRTLTLAEMTKEYQNGKVNWIYSCDPENGHIVPGIVSWAGVTQKSAKVLKIVLDNDKEFIVTPDHKFPVIGKGFVEAKNLVVNESMIPFAKQNKNLGVNKKSEYTQIYQPDTKEWEFVHRMVVKNLKPFNLIETNVYNQLYKDEKKGVIHHYDINRFNNSPENLVLMGSRDHLCYHSENAKSIWQNLSDEEKLSNDLELMSHYKQLNGNRNCANWLLDKISPYQVKSIVKQFGYKGWQHFRKDVSNYNHRIVSIEWLDNPIEVGTLTIDVNEKYHNYHTFALDCGIFNKNSNLGEITDLRFFTNKMFRGLRIPSSYLPTQADDSQTQFSDGKVGIAMIQEWRFNQYCKRLQSLMASALDREFKLFMRFRGINIDSSVFDLKFNEPQNFTKYRQAEIDNARIGSFSQIEQYPYLSKRFILQRYLGLSEEEMQENEQMWAEEHADTEIAKPEDANLRSVGVSAGGISADLGNMEPMPGLEGGTPSVEAPGVGAAQGGAVAPAGGAAAPTGGPVGGPA